MNGKALQERLWRFVPAPVRSPAQLVVRAVSLWISEGGPQYGAAIAFYTMFALAPLLVLAIWVTGLVFGADAARGQLVGQIESMVGPVAARGIESLIEAAWREPGGNLAGALAIATLLVGASGVFAQLRRALNAMTRIREVESPVGAFVRARLVAFVLVLGFGLLATTLLLASTTLAALGAWLAPRLSLPGLPALLALGDVAISTGVIAVGVASLLRWLPDRPPSRRAVWIGALTTAVLFSLGKHLIGLYLARASVASSYGAAGSFVVVMMWMYYSAQILLFGASLGHAVDERQGLVPGGAAPLDAFRPARPSQADAGGALPLHDGGLRREPGVDEEPRGSGRDEAPAGSGSSGGAKVLPFTPAARSRRDLRRPGA